MLQLLSKIFVAWIVCSITLSSSSPIVAHSRAARNTIDDDIDVGSDTDRSHNLPVTQLTHDNGKCVFVKAEEGIYSYNAPGGTADVCGLYLISKPDQVIEIEFEEYYVQSCAMGGLVSVINGWELNGQFFPGINDFSATKESRYHQFCSEKPLSVYTMEQNVGLVMFRLPIQGEGFKLRVKFRPNAQPCNVVLQDPSGIYTLRNYGRRINCTASIMFPESFRLLSTSIGSASIAVSSSRNTVETGLIRQCRGSGLADYAELRGGDGLDASAMASAGDFCGVDSIPAAHKIDILCGNTAMRLISSGLYDNSVTFAFDLFMEPKSAGLTCPSFLENL